MSRFWTPPWEHLEATEALEIVITHQDEYLQLAGEPFYLLQKKYSGDKVIANVGNFDIDPQVLMPRAILWHADTHEAEDYPDPLYMTVTIATASGPVVLEQAPDKDLFIASLPQYALDIRQQKVDANQDPLPDAVFIVLNSPPHNGSDPVKVEYKSISPATDFHSRQPLQDNVPGFEDSLRGYKQWLDENRLYRGDVTPHIIPLALPQEPLNLTVEAAGMTRTSRISWWTNVPPFVPVVSEHDILVRAQNDARYEVIDQEYGWLGTRIKEQKFTAVLLENNDPRYNIEMKTE